MKFWVLREKESYLMAGQMQESSSNSTQLMENLFGLIRRVLGFMSYFYRVGRLNSDDDADINDQ